MVDGSQSTQVHCDNCGWVGHPRERCFDLYPELILGHGGGRGRAAQKGHGGKGGRGGGGGQSTPAIGAALVATPPFTIKVAMAARIEQL